MKKFDLHQECAWNNKPGLKWIQKRKQTYLSSLFFWFQGGLQASMMFATSRWYVTQGMHSSNPNLDYGLISSAVTVLPITLGIPISKWFDTSRSLRSSTCLANVAMVAGYCVYMISFSPYFPFVGAILSGANLVTRGLTNAELLRSYETDDIAAYYVLSLIVYGSGEFLGPLCLKLMDSTDFWIGDIHIMYGNLPALLLLVITIFRIVVTFFFVHDLSKEFDLKEQSKQHLIQSDATDSQHHVTDDQHHDFNRDVQIDTCLLITHQFLSAMLGTQVFPMFFPLFAEKFAYSNFFVDLCYMGCSICFVFISLLIKWLKPNARDVYVCGVLDPALILLGYVVTIALVTCRFSNAVNYLLITVFIVAYATSWICEMTFVTMAIGRIHPSSRQGVIESIRMMAKTAGAFSGALLAPFAYKYNTYFMPISSVVIFCLLIVVVVRRETLINTKAK